jgi:predicted RNA binding protein YcfA (HicA-like mRNA interferase family)
MKDKKPTLTELIAFATCPLCNEGFTPEQIKGHHYHYVTTSRDTTVFIHIKCGGSITVEKSNRK